MTFYLALGLADEPETHAVAEGRSHGADGERARVPQWIEEARSRLQLRQAGLAPGEMVSFLTSRLHQHHAGRFGSGDEGLAVIEGLRGHLAGVVHSHEGAGFPS